MSNLLGFWQYFLFGPQLFCHLTSIVIPYLVHECIIWDDVSHIFLTSVWPWTLASISKLFLLWICVWARLFLVITNLAYWCITMRRNMYIHDISVWSLTSRLIFAGFGLINGYWNICVLQYDTCYECIAIKAGFAHISSWHNGEKLQFLGHLSSSGDLLLWVGVRRRALCVGKCCCFE